MGAELVDDLIYLFICYNKHFNLHLLLLQNHTLLLHQDLLQLHQMEISNTPYLLNLTQESLEQEMMKKSLDDMSNIHLM